ncbi:MAG TPA: TIR domain-containing protein [Pseudonocardiaceae bacterium]|nr:TIR domain-containing protein [Pseudonocardiaceae bacterium]
MAGASRDYDVFLSFSWVDDADATVIDERLRQAGLTVFRDSRCIDEFDAITQELAEALASSKVLLAYYSAAYPTRPACQWELISAFIAAGRHGDPVRRVLAINPEPTADHLVPVQLADARYFPRPRDAADMARLVARVQDRVHAADGPLGAPGHRFDAAVPPEIYRTTRFVGRFAQLWQVHSALHSVDFPANTETSRCAVAVIEGLAGIGKTSLAGQYGHLFRDSFPGGIHWTGPFGTDEETVAQYFADLRQIATTRLRLHATDIEHDRLRTLLAERIDRDGRPVLLIVDGVPSGIDPDTLDRMLVPSPLVRMLFTSRGGSAGWDVPVIRLAGLTEDEGRALFTGVRPLVGPAELAAAAELVAAAVRRDRALVALGQPDTAQAALTETERTLTKILGADHPLRCQARYAIAQCHGQRGEFLRGRAILAELLPIQTAGLGADHPDTLVTKLDLGIALALTGEHTAGKALVAEAAPKFGAELGWRSDNRIRATVTRLLLDLPPGVLNASLLLDKFLNRFNK